MHELMIMKEAGPSRPLDKRSGPQEMQRLTPREQGIAQLVSAGLSNKQIARQLTVTEGTIKVHLHNVYDKLAIRNRTMLALLCAGTAPSAALRPRFGWDAWGNEVEQIEAAE